MRISRGSFLSRVLPCSFMLLLASNLSAASQPVADAARVQKATNALDNAIVGGKAAAQARLSKLSTKQLQAMKQASVSSGETTVTYNPNAEALKRLKINEDITAETTDLLGERIDLNTGALSFQHTDVAIPGNSGLEVAIRRVFRGFNYAFGHTLNFGDWQLAVPHISTTLIELGADNPEGPFYSGSWGYGLACSGNLNPGITHLNIGHLAVIEGAPGLPYMTHKPSSAFWSGDALDIPGVANEKLLQGPQSSPRVVKNWRISCFDLPDGSGEGFLAEAPNGTRYTFDKLRLVPTSPIPATVVWQQQWAEPRAIDVAVPRYHALMMVSKIEDRFGNWVKYHYAGTELERIEANDGRLIEIEYEMGTWSQRIKAVKAHGKEWRYAYTNATVQVPNAEPDWLHTVTRPDGKKWRFNLKSLNFGVGPRTNEVQEQWGFAPGGGDGPTRILISSTETECMALPDAYRSPVATIEHPNGVIGEFSLGIQRFGRSQVPEIWSNQPNNTVHAVNRCFAANVLREKKLTGPGLVPQTWQYSYSGNSGQYVGRSNGEPLTGLLQTPEGYTPMDLRATSVRAPDGSKTVHVFSRRWQFDEGQEVATEYYDTNGVTPLKQTSRKFAAAAIGGSAQLSSQLFYFDEYRDFYNFDNVAPHEHYVNKTSEVQTVYVNGLQADTYTTLFDNYVYGVPGLTIESNSLSGNKRRWTRNTYLHDTTLWLLNIPRRTELSSDGVNYTNVSETDYHPAAAFGCTSCGNSYQPMLEKRFGSTVKTYESYHGDGNVKRVSFGKSSRWQELSNYKRGTAQRIVVPKRYESSCTVGSTCPQATLVVRDDGNIESIVDFNGNSTSYGYDSLGRLILINPSDSRWSDTEIRYADVDGADLAISGSGLATGQLKQVRTRGNYEKTVYFDALLRPVLVRERDIADPLTERFTRTTVNAYGKPTFKSQPSNFAGETKGNGYTYDGLQRSLRVTDTVDNSYSETRYQSDNKLVVRNPRGYETTTTFQAYGAPAHDQPIRIESPENVTTVLQYNLFGNVTSVVQGNFTEKRLYNTRQHLCKRIRPETGQTLYYPNTFGEVQWYAEGLSGSTTSCETSTTSASKVTLTYDNHGALYTEDFADAATADRTYSLDPQGNLKTLAVGSDNQWVYEYNSAHLLETETAIVDGYNWLLDYGYNSNGHLQSLTYPTGLSVEFSPNALGQAREAGGYATNAQYHANGLLKSFVFGNGVSHEVSQTAQGYPELFTTRYGGNLSQFKYSYDNVGNIERIDDYVTSSWSKSFTYDGMDRLITANGPWGSGSFAYDTVGNITSKVLGSQALSYQYNSVSNRLDSVSGSVTASMSYDSRGNVTHNGRNGLGYNMANQLVEVIGSNEADYYYDGHGRRIKDLINGQSTYSLYNKSGQLLFKYVPQTDFKSSYVYLGSQLIAKHEQTPNTPPVPTLTVPTGVHTSSTVNISWNSVTQATRYLLDEKKDNGVWTTVHNGAGTNVALTGRGNGSYSYRIKACNGAGSELCSGFASSAAFTVLLPPAAPVSITVPTGTQTSGSFSVSWSASATATRYVLEEQKNTGGWVAVYDNNGTSTTLSSRGNGSYLYRVKACNNGGSSCSGSTLSTSVTVLLPPAVPILTTPTGTDPDGLYTVSWTAVSTATSYSLEEQVNGGLWTAVYNNSGTSAAFSRGNGSYAYRVRACNASCSAFATNAAFTVLLPPAAPSLNTPTGTDTDGAYTISWGASATATSYQLNEQINGGGWTGLYTGSALSTTVNGRGNGNYAYQVRACNSSGCSAYSTGAMFTVFLPPGTPSLSTPASTDGDGSFALNWSLPATTASTRIEESVNGGGWTEILNVGGSGTTLSGRGFASYRYRARSCNSSGCSGYSNEAAITVLKPTVAAWFNPTTVAYCQSAGFNWQASNADYCTLNGQNVPTTGNQWQVYYEDTTIAVRCYRESAFETAQATIRVLPGTECQ